MSVRRDLAPLFLPFLLLATFHSPASFFKEIRNTGPHRTQSKRGVSHVGTFRFLTPWFGFRRDWRPLERSYIFTRPKYRRYRCIALAREMRAPDNGRPATDLMGGVNFRAGRCTGHPSTLPNVTP